MQGWYRMACAARHFLTLVLRSLVPVGGERMGWGRERRRHSAGEVRWDRASRLAGCVLFCHNHLINYAFVILEEVLSLPILDGNR